MLKESLLFLLGDLLKLQGLLLTTARGQKWCSFHSVTSKTWFSRARLSDSAEAFVSPVNLLVLILQVLILLNTVLPIGHAGSFESGEAVHVLLSYD